MGIVGRSGGSTGAAGAFAPVNFQQQVHCTSPDEELSYRWPFSQSENKLFQAKMELLAAKMWYNFKFLGVWDHHLTLKNFVHPSCQVLDAAPIVGMVAPSVFKNG